MLMTCCSSHLRTCRDLRRMLRKVFSKPTVYNNRNMPDVEGRSVRRSETPSTPATMSKQHCETLQVEVEQSRMLLQNCCWCGRSFRRHACMAGYDGIEL